MVPRIRTSGASQTPRLRRLASKLCQGEHMGARRSHCLKWPLALFLATGVFMHSSYAETIGFDTDAVGSLPDSWVEEIGRASCREKSVDLGGRRIIKKKKKKYRCRTVYYINIEGEPYERYVQLSVQAHSASMVCIW